MNGLFCIDKEPGPTSFGVIREFSKLLEKKLGVRRRDLPSIGHCGTLDPFASGLLLVCVGPAVKLASYLLGDEKTYTGEIVFGAQTESGDFETPIFAESPIRPASLEQIQSAAQTFCEGDYLQTPPMYSAKKIAGKALYELARQGRTVPRAAVALKVKNFLVSNYDGERCFFSVSVSSGTYIRVLAEDLAKKLGTLAALKSLRRTESSGFQINEAKKLKELELEWTANKSGPFTQFDQILKKVPRVEIHFNDAKDIYHGKKEVLRSLDLPEDLTLRALYCDEKLIALMRGREFVRAFGHNFA